MNRFIWQRSSSQHATTGVFSWTAVWFSGYFRLEGAWQPPALSSMRRV
jgi:hypothetical protein